MIRFIAMALLCTSFSAVAEIQAPSVLPATPATEMLERALAAQSDEVKARYDARNPAATLQFFGIEPGMTVVETDPGGGWYSQILLAYLGESGRLVGADFAIEMYPLFEYYNDEELAAKATWSERWPDDVKTSSGAEVAAFNLGSMPESMNESIDAFLFIRTMHNLMVFEEEGAFLTTALSEAYRALKPGGVVGIVQHMAPESNSDEWASGDNGYIKRNAVVAAMEGAGFLLDGESAINFNSADIPSEAEYVWRLPPTSEDVGDPELAAAYAAIGESNRMTMRFLKPPVNE